ncbi:MAG TPA: YqaA family protein [Methylomirabilota bacterium]
MSSFVHALNAPRRWARDLYDWTIRWADTRQSLVALFLIAFAESSVFPIPPDVLLIAIVGAQPLRWLTAASICTAGSVAGAALGYLIGSVFMAAIGQPIVDVYGAQHHWTRVVEMYTGPWGIWFLAGAAFTPIPFKVATIAAGATGMAFWPFIAVSALGRAGRFFAVAVLLRLFGTPIRRLLERHFDLFALLFFVLLLGGFLVIRAF